MSFFLRAFLYWLLGPLLIAYYLFSCGKTRLASIWQTTNDLSMYSVHIHVRNSAKHASVLLPSFYPTHVNELLRHNPVPPDVFHRERSYVLRQKYAGSTPLCSLRQVLETETGIPLSIQNHFGRGECDGTNEEWGEGRERDTVTLDDLWAVEKDKVEGEVHVCLVTTAGRLQEIFDLDERPDRLVGKILLWRHHVASLRYMRNASDRAPGEQKRQDLEEKIQEFERLERASSKEVRSMFWDWDRIIGGV